MTTLINWLKTIDPGWLRLEQSIKGALAYISATLVTAMLISAWAPPSAASAVVYSLLMAFMSFMAVNETHPAERRITLLLTAIPSVLAPFVVGLVQPSGLLNYGLLLLLMFLSYYFRRFGLRAAELALVTVFAYYFSMLFGATWATAPWFALGAVVAILSAYLWQFIIRPFDPQRYLERAVGAFEQNAAEVVAALAQSLSSPLAISDAQVALKHVHASRKIIEQQLAGVSGLPNWPPQRLAQVRLQLFDTEQGLQRMVEATQTLAPQMNQLPGGLRDALAASLAALKDALARLGAPEPMAALERTRATLVEEARHARDDLEAVKPELLRIGIGGAQVVRAMQAVHELVEQSRAPAGAAGQPAPPSAPAQAAPRSAQPPGLHPTTMLGLQAVLAAGLGMLICGLLHLDHPNWTYWTAFIVVAGSVGESLRKLGYRVVGTVVGALVGTLLAVILPPNTLLVFGLMMVFLFMALYTRVINYAWTVFWIVLFVAVMYELGGTPPMVVLIQRPLNTLIGAVVAALVVWYVFPIRAGDRFRKALAQYVTALDGYLAVLGGANGANQPAGRAAAEMQLSSAYEGMTQTFPAVAMEYSPFAQARSPLTAQTTVVNAIQHDALRLADTMTGDGGAMDDGVLRLLQWGQPLIHANIESLKQVLNQQPSQPFHPWADNAQALDGRPALDGVASLRRSEHVQLLSYLSRINHSIVELGEEFAATPRPAVKQ
jgi:uncharacterized membrane protein YccC